MTLTVLCPPTASQTSPLWCSMNTQFQTCPKLNLTWSPIKPDPPIWTNSFNGATRPWPQKPRRYSSSCALPQLCSQSVAYLASFTVPMFFKWIPFSHSYQSSVSIQNLINCHLNHCSSFLFLIARLTSNRSSMQAPQRYFWNKNKAVALHLKTFSCSLTTIGEGPHPLAHPACPQDIASSTASLPLHTFYPLVKQIIS